MSSLRFVVLACIVLSACESTPLAMRGGTDGGSADVSAHDASATDDASACLAATQICDGADCCAGLTCGETSLGHVCCGNDGAPCATSDGSDCCGTLECVSGHCQAPSTCFPATRACTGTECCAGLLCGTTTLGRVCCGNTGATCATADGSDCCGSLECVSGHCVAPASCLAATDPCSGGGCCAGLTCGTTSLGHVCCGNSGAPCATADGSDCCGSLECISGHCAAPSACLTRTQRCTGSECCAGLTCGTTSLGQVCCGNSGASCATADGSDCCGSLECISGHCGYPSSGGGGGVISACTESAILAAAPHNAVTFIQRALDWVHRGAPYSQVPQSTYGGYRTDCSGLVAMSWGRPAPGETTYSFAGGPWFDGSSVRLASWNDIRIGDATNYPGDPSAGTGHIRLFAGWLDSGHTQYCSIEEYDYGHPAEVRSHTLDRSIYIPIRLSGFTPSSP